MFLSLWVIESEKKVKKDYEENNILPKREWEVSGKRIFDRFRKDKFKISVKDPF